MKIERVWEKPYKYRMRTPWTGQWTYFASSKNVRGFWGMGRTPRAAQADAARVRTWT